MFVLVGSSNVLQSWSKNSNPTSSLFIKHPISLIIDRKVYEHFPQLFSIQGIKIFLYQRIIFTLCIVVVIYYFMLLIDLFVC